MVTNDKNLNAGYLSKEQYFKRYAAIKKKSKETIENIYRLSSIYLNTTTFTDDLNLVEDYWIDVRYTKKGEIVIGSHSDLKYADKGTRKRKK